MLKDFLREKNTSIYALAKESGVPYSTLNDLTNNKVDIDNCKVSLLKAVAETLNLSFEEFYHLCAGKEQKIQTSYGVEPTLSVRNKAYHISFEYDGKSVEIELCKVNDDTRYYINQIAKWRTESYIRKERMKKFK